MFTAPKTKSRLLQHRLVHLCGLALTACIAAMVVLDLPALNQNSGTIDLSFKFSPSPKIPDLPYGYVYDEEKIRPGTAYDGSLLVARDWSSQKVGFVNAAGKIVIPAKFTAACDFENGRAPAQANWPVSSASATAATGSSLPNQKKLWGVINERGDWTITPRFPFPPQFLNGTSEMDVDYERHEIVDEKGAVLFQSEPSCNIHRVGHAYLARSKGNCGLLDSHGKWIIPAAYESIGEVGFNMIEERIFSGTDSDFDRAQNEYLVIASDNLDGLADQSGHIFFQPKFTHICWVSGKHLVFRNGSKYGVADLAGNVVLKEQYDFITAYGAVMAVARDSSWTLIDSHGKTIEGSPNIGGVSSSAGMPWFSEGLAPVIIGEKFGYIDEHGKLAIEPKFEWAGRFHDGLAVVADGSGCTHYIDRSGKRHGPDYLSCAPFDKGKAKVYLPDILYLLNWKNAQRTREECADARKCFHDAKARVKRDIDYNTTKGIDT